MMTRQNSRKLVSQAAGAYALLIVGVSLYPFAGWRDSGLPLLFFLDAAWLRYWTAFDLATNIVAYLPLGALLTLSFWTKRWRLLSVLAALLLGSALSLSMECVQAFLPSRISSNVDWVSNSVGTALGAFWALWKGQVAIDKLNVVQYRLLAPLSNVEFGLLLLALWLLTQLSPETFLFGTGDIRLLLNIPPTLPYQAPSFLAIETTITVCNLVAIGLLGRTLLASSGASVFILPLFVLVALLIRTLSAAILVSPGNALAWFTPGAALGLLLGSLTLLPLLFLPIRLRLIFAGLALMTGTVLVNLIEPNPYSVAALSAWRQGHFLNFNGLTRLSASFWPFLALPYLMFLLGEKRA